MQIRIKSLCANRCGSCPKIVTVDFSSFALIALGLTIRQPMAYEKPHHAMLQICRQQRPRKLGSRETLLSMVNKKSFKFDHCIIHYH